MLYNSPVLLHIIITFFRCLVALLHLLSSVCLVVLTGFVVLSVTDALWNLLTHGVVLSLVSQVLVEFIYFTFLYRFAENNAEIRLREFVSCPSHLTAFLTGA